MKGKLIWSIFWVLVAIFVLSICMMFIQALMRSPARISFFIAWPVIAGLGVALIVLTVKQKMSRTLKKFLLLTGASAAGLPVFGVLHNLVSALFNIEEAVFFVLATIVCPAGFLVGVVGVIVFTVKNKPPRYSAQNI
jgi:peptidoglycan/LPS O-acetylase OafA/YrhL